MRVQNKIALNCVKKSLRWFVILLVIVVIYIITIKFLRSPTITDFYSILGIVDLSNTSFFGILMMIYQYAVTLYFSYIFYNYEINEEVDNVIIRMDQQKWIITKNIICYVYIAAFRIIYTIYSSFFYSVNIHDLIIIAFSVSSNYFLLISLTFFLSNHLKQRKKEIYILLTLLIFLLHIVINSFIFNYFMLIIISMYEFKSFNFKKLYYK